MLGPWPRLLLAAAALAWAAAPKTPTDVGNDILNMLRFDPNESDLRSLLPMIAHMPDGPRLALAKKLVKARPRSAAFQLALADAYGANAKRRLAVRTLLAISTGAVDDVGFEVAVASSMARWGSLERAAALAARDVAISSEPACYLRYADLTAAYSRTLAGGGPHAALRADWERQVQAGSRALKPWLLRAQALSLQKDYDALRRHCEAALDIFPGERRFYDGLDTVLKVDDDYPGVVRLKRREIEALPRASAAEYVDLAYALLRTQRPEQAKDALDEGLRDGRLPAQEARKLAQRREAFAALSDAIAARAPDDAAACRYDDAGASVAVACSGAALTYDFKAHAFQTAEDPASAARVAGALLERFDAARLAAAAGAKEPADDDALIWLKAEGYLEP